MNFFKKIFREVKRVASQVTNLVTGIPVLGKILPYAGGPIAPLIQAAGLIDDPMKFISGGIDVASSVLLGQATGGISSMLANPLQTMVGTIPQSVVTTLNAPGALASLQKAIGIPTNMTAGGGTSFLLPGLTEDIPMPEGWLESQIRKYGGDLGGMVADTLGDPLLNDLALGGLDALGIGGAAEDLGIIGDVTPDQNPFSGYGEDYGPFLDSLPQQKQVQVQLPVPFENGGQMDFAIARRLPRTIPLGALVGDSGQTMLPQGYHVKTLGFRRPYAGRNAGAYAVRNRRTNYLNLSALRRASHRLTGATKIVRHLFTLPKHTIRSKKRSTRFGKGR